ncbi:hypothetical protein SAMN05421785_103201 [Chryseobacterium gambrini]|uniref:Uncharacterized protein n=1 Tax=Chryseobacterium gambrini TaxID=373672 RepID=A0A1N7MGF1_9FLAO|nr:hypothetical protein SAMN05421785_103201 [Chryseobacterium gambrini]
MEYFIDVFVICHTSVIFSIMSLPKSLSSKYLQYHFSVLIAIFCFSIARLELDSCQEADCL